jgi:hypothetical protein
MTAPNAITAIQDALVKKIIDTLSDLPNVLWIVSEEAPSHSKWWNDHLIAFARSYEAAKPVQHPIGYGVLDDFNDSVLLDSDADWIAPAARIPQSRLRDFVDRRKADCGKGHPPCKVIINDSDHSYFGMWNDSAQVNRNFFWVNFTTGNQTIFKLYSWIPMSFIIHAKIAISAYLLLMGSVLNLIRAGMACGIP